MYKSDVIGMPQWGGLADPVSCALWVYGHKAWVNTLAIEPGWLGAVYQGQPDPSNTAMQKIHNKAISNDNHFCFG